MIGELIIEILVRILIGVVWEGFKKLVWTVFRIVTAPFRLLLRSIRGGNPENATEEP